uniref:transmembrane protein 163 n=1 Tax=Myxine glutinosa TaxID=7769 RepID=UPI00358ED6BA
MHSVQSTGLTELRRMTRPWVDPTTELHVGLLESSQRLRPQEAQVYRRWTLAVSLLSIVITLALAVAAFVVSSLQSSAAAFGFAFDALLDVLSSIIVVWRYSKAGAVHSAHREYQACVVLGIIFLLSAVCIMSKAIHDLVRRLLPEVDDFLLTVSILSGVVCLILSVAKFALGRILTSKALITDGFNSLVGGLMGFSMLASAEIYASNPNVWYIDGTIGLVIAIVILAYGIRLLFDVVPRVWRVQHYENIA